MNLHNFVYGAADPWGTVSVDKLPGALWFQALSLRIFGFHVWALVLPQVVEGMLTVLVLYRAVRRVAGAGAGLVAARRHRRQPGRDPARPRQHFGLVAHPVAGARGRRHHPRLPDGAAALPALGGRTGGLRIPDQNAPGLDRPPGALRRLPGGGTGRLASCAACGTWRRPRSWWRSSRSATCRPSRSCRSPVARTSTGAATTRSSPRCSRTTGSAASARPPPARRDATRSSTWLHTLAAYSARSGLGTFGIGASWDRLLQGPFGHDAAWLLLPTVASAVWLLVLRRRTPRTDIRRAAAILWSIWLVVTFGFFSGGKFLNSYYLAALIPPVAALCGMGALAAWERRRLRAVRAALLALTVATVAVTVALVPGYVGVRTWIIGSLPSPSGSWPSSCSAAPSAAVTTRSGPSPWGRHWPPLPSSSERSGPRAWWCRRRLGPFDSPYAPASVNAYTQTRGGDIPHRPEGAGAVRQRPPTETGRRRLGDVERGRLLHPRHRPRVPPGGRLLRASPGPVRFPTSSGWLRQGRVQRVTVVTKPLTRAPDLRWVVAHCKRFGPTNYDAAAQAERSLYYCTASEASGPAHRTQSVSAAARRPRPVGSRGTASPA